MESNYAPAIALLVGILVLTTLVVVTLRWRGKSWPVVVLGGVAAVVIGYVVGQAAIFLMW
ncbi:hypothetical protein [Nocardia transvalensis]|uniref:hypothetical protein n=1 Tax=Nocardia transvalensis TaxID=37333 RepID=UPI001895B670|nr:hypothetical protein [Nocardia transvalensis]MBF6328465.1 hypothetical protein [Nocardia transvalensis]